VTSNGTTVNISTGGTYIGSGGVSFSAAIVSGTFYLYYTTTSTGSNATMKFMVRRWSNSAGGPAGVPSYSGASSSSSAAGPNESIQFNNGGLLDGSSSFLIDSTNQVMILNGEEYSVLSGPITIVDNTTNGTLFTYPAATYPFVVVEYSIVRNGNYRVGRIFITNDGTNPSYSEDYVSTTSAGATGVTISATIVGGNVEVQYTSTNLSLNGTFKYSVRRWS
jgi:hypothetical protein